MFMYRINQLTMSRYMSALVLLRESDKLTRSHPPSPNETTQH
jgi:hypothetical protein